jgi:hypothetical protein
VDDPPLSPLTGRCSSLYRNRTIVEDLHTNTTATGSWTIYRWGWQLSGTQGLDEAYVPLFGAFGAARDDAMVARWSANSLGIL